MYKIKINKMQFRTHIGLLPEEKLVGQNLEIDLLVETSFDFSGKDVLSETLSYVKFYDLIQEYIQLSQANLLEKMAYDLIQSIRSEYPQKIASVEIHLRKLNVPINGIFDSVEIEMKG